jgi:hypothetical protein
MRRLHLVAALSASALAAASAPAPAAELPDLEQVAPYEVRAVHRDGRVYLGFATAVRNVGAGALRIRGQRRPSGTMAAAQLSEDGLAVLNPAVGTLRYVTSYGHGHWHFMRFMRYELRGMDVPGASLDRKQGFCLGDAPFVDGWCARGKPEIAAVEEGIRAGGIDIYEPNVEGQEIEIDRHSAPSGRYVLTSRIGPTGAIRETRTDNNVASTVIALRWPLADGQPIAPILSCVGEGCAGPVPPLPRLRRMTATEARRFARKAMRREIGPTRARLRVRCRDARKRGKVCAVRLARGHVRFRGTIRVWYAREGAATRWYYSVNVVRRVTDCDEDCARRIRSTGRRGGTRP